MKLWIILITIAATASQLVVSDDGSEYGGTEVGSPGTMLHYKFQEGQNPESNPNARPRDSLATNLMGHFNLHPPAVDWVVDRAGVRITANDTDDGVRLVSTKTVGSGGLYGYVKGATSLAAYAWFCTKSSYAIADTPFGNVGLIFGIVTDNDESEEDAILDDMCQPVCNNHTLFELTFCGYYWTAKISVLDSTGNAQCNYVGITIPDNWGAPWNRDYCYFIGVEQLEDGTIRGYNHDDTVPFGSNAGTPGNFSHWNTDARVKIGRRLYGEFEQTALSSNPEGGIPEYHEFNGRILEAVLYNRSFLSGEVEAAMFPGFPDSAPELSNLIINYDAQYAIGPGCGDLTIVIAPNASDWNVEEYGDSYYSFEAPSSGYSSSPAQYEYNMPDYMFMVVSSLPYYGNLFTDSGHNTLISSVPYALETPIVYYLATQGNVVDNFTYVYQDEYSRQSDVGYVYVDVTICPEFGGNSIGTP